VTTGPVDPVAFGDGRLRASDADRERAVEALKAAFTQGRLTRDELDRRAGQALLARTYADLAAATANMPARPAPRRPGPARPALPRPRADWPPPALTAPEHPRPANHWAYSCALGLATVVLPVMMIAALHDRSQDLFCVSIVLLMAYVMAMVIAGANVMAARFDDGGRRQSRTRRLSGAAPFIRGRPIWGGSGGGGLQASTSAAVAATW
jgi:DUF1707 SHOCT-like domain